MATTEELLALRQKRRQDMSEEEVKTATQMFSIRERLEYRLNHGIIKVEIGDDPLGKLELSFRRLTPMENDQLRNLHKKLTANPNDLETIDKVYDILGKASHDGLDKEFWKSGTGYSPDVFITALMKVVSSSAFPDKKYLEDIDKFRP